MEATSDLDKGSFWGVLRGKQPNWNQGKIEADDYRDSKYKFLSLLKMEQKWYWAWEVKKGDVPFCVYFDGENLVEKTF